MNSFIFPPGCILILGALFLPLFPKKLRAIPALGFPLLTLLTVWMVTPDHSVIINFLGYELELVRWTAEGRVFATIFSLVAGIGALYALKTARRLELSAAFVYAGSAISVTFCGDLISLFVFWEIMAIGSTMVLWSNSRDNARIYQSSIRYLIVHLLGGVLLMVGIASYIATTGSSEFTGMRADSFGTIMILLGFLVNAGAPPFTSWIADAYPEASPSGAVFLSAFTTKTAVFVLLMGFAGETVLIYVGLYMAFYGVIYALLENDIRRILAYSIVNQVGFMVVAIGIGSELALNGATAHAFAHILYKALLLMSAGSVILMTGKRKCTDLGGLFQTMPYTTGAAIVGSLAISAPLTSGFISKSLELSAAAEAGLPLVWFLLIAASVGGFVNAGIKYTYFVFFQEDSGIRTEDPPKNMLWGMGLLSALCISIGIMPSLLYDILPYPLDYEPYTVSHVVSQIQLLLFAGFAFFILLILVKPALTISLDFDWFYRKFFPGIVNWIKKLGPNVIDPLVLGSKAFGQQRFNHLFEVHGPQGIFARTWPSASMVLWVAILLATSMILYYVNP